MLQILLEGTIVELCKELDRHGGIKPADIIDELTFIHILHTFKIECRRSFSGP